MKGFICIFALIVISLFATVDVKAIYGCPSEYYIVSDTWNVGGTIYGYSATELSVCAGLYNDPVVASIFTENSTTLLGQGYSEGYADYIPAEVGFAYANPAAGQTYRTFGDHYVIAYYQVYMPYWNDWFWYDPWQLGFMEVGGGYEAPGFYGFGQAYYWYSQYIYIGSTNDSITYCGQTQCQSGQQFTSTGVACNFQPPPNSGVCNNPDPTQPKLTVKEVGFLNDFPIKSLETGVLYNQSGVATPSNASDDTPSWTSLGGKKFPTAYIKNTDANSSKPTLWIKFLVENANPANANLALRVKYNGQVYAAYASGLGGTNGEYILSPFALTTALPNSSVIRKSDYDFTWEYSIDQTNWTSAGTSSHTIHWLYGNPITMSSNPNQSVITQHVGLYDEALDHSTGILGEGTNSESEVVEKISQHLAAFITYDPRRLSSNENPINVFLERREKALECSENSTLLVALLNSIGIGNNPNNGLAIKFYAGGNVNIDTVHEYNDPLTGFPRMTGQYSRPASDGVPMNPRFVYHSTVLFNGRSYDPSYGIVENEAKLIEAVNVVNSVPFCITGDLANSLKITRNNGQNVNKSNFGSVCGVSLPRNSIIISQSVPSDLQVGQTYAVSITLQNTGMNTWRASEGYQLGSQNPQDNSIWGLNRVNLPHDVLPGQLATFNFSITAPSTAATYDFQWQMLQNGIGWFGAITGSVPIEVLGNAECSSGDQQACYWQGGYWNHSTCTCEGIY